MHDRFKVVALPRVRTPKQVQQVRHETMVDELGAYRLQVEVLENDDAEQ